MQSSPVPGPPERGQECPEATHCRAAAVYSVQRQRTVEPPQYTEVLIRLPSSRGTGKCIWWLSGQQEQRNGIAINIGVVTTEPSGEGAHSMCTCPLAPREFNLLTRSIASAACVATITTATATHATTAAHVVVATVDTTILVGTTATGIAGYTSAMGGAVPIAVVGRAALRAHRWHLAARAGPWRWINVSIDHTMHLARADALAARTGPVPVAVVHEHAQVGDALARRRITNQRRRRVDRRWTIHIHRSRVRAHAFWQRPIARERICAPIRTHQLRLTNSQVPTIRH